MKITCLTLSTTVMLSAGLLASCGPQYAPPSAPSSACPVISQAAFDAAKDAGATSATAKIRDNGIVTMNIGAGIKHCSSFTGSKQVCRRPNAFVIHYTMPNGGDTFVRVPKDREYRLNNNRKPVPCEIIDR
jgi:hypothetical protein